MRLKLPVLLLFICSPAIAFLPKQARAQSKKEFIVKVNEPKGNVQPTMWGVFFEDINFGADGGLYAELVKNRSFEFGKPLMGWTVQQKKFTEGAVLVLNRKEIDPANPHYIRLNADHALKGDLGLTNEGFRGMGIKKGLRYDFSVMYQPAKCRRKIIC